MEIIKNFSIYGATPRAPGFARFRRPAPCRAAHAGASLRGREAPRSAWQSVPAAGRSSTRGMAAAARCAPLQSRASSSGGHAPSVFARGNPPRPPVTERSLPPLKERAGNRGKPPEKKTGKKSEKFLKKNKKSVDTK